MYGVFPYAVPVYGDAINQPGSHTKQYRKVLSIPCTTRSCPFTFPPDIETYSLQTNIQFSPAYAFTVTCPTGYTCVPGTFPRTVEYPPDTFIIPDPLRRPGFPTVVQLAGCQSTVTEFLASDATDAQINAAVQRVLAEVARQQAECDSITDVHPNRDGYLNEPANYLVDCDDGYALTYSGALPSWIELDADNSTLTAKAGTFSGATQAEANATAQSMLANWATAALTAETLTCELACMIDTASPLPDGTEGEAYSETLAASVITGTLAWTISGGALPDGLTLDSATGEISGTPTDPDVFNFEVQVSNGTIDCHKEFQITIEEAVCVIDNSSPLPSGDESVAYSDTLTATGITGTLTWSVVAGALPDGLTLNSATGEISGTPTVPNTFNFTIQVSNE